jgi:hypothetical protein
MRKTIVKESADEKYIREFINHVCNGDMANANVSLNTAVVKKMKTLIQKNLKGEKTNED